MSEALLSSEPKSKLFPERSSVEIAGTVVKFGTVVMLFDATLKTFNAFMVVIDAGTAPLTLLLGNSILVTRPPFSVMPNQFLTALTVQFVRVVQLVPLVPL